MATSDRNIYARIQQAYKTIAAKGFTKDGQVKGAASYKFISIGQILEAVRKAQADAGITVIFGRPEYDHDNHEKRWEFTKKSQFGESTWYAAVGHISVTLYGADADDFIQTEIPFEAQDNSDKLTNKIITNAERTLYRTLYSIDEGTDEDPEAYNIPMVPETPAKPDPFFGAPKKAPAKQETLTDRPVADMAAAIEKWWKIPAIQPVLKKRMQELGILDMENVTDDEIRELYKAGANAGRASQ